MLMTVLKWYLILLYGGAAFFDICRNVEDGKSYGTILFAVCVSYVPLIYYLIVK